MAKYNFVYVVNVKGKRCFSTIIKKEERPMGKYGYIILPFSEKTGNALLFLGYRYTGWL